MALGVGEQQAAKYQQARAAQGDETPAFALWAANLPAARLFLRVCGLWRYAGMGAMVGLDYPAIKIDLDYSQITVDPGLWEDLKIMERAAVKAMREKC